MTDLYKALARKLDEMPQGYPPTESGVELKILKKLFTPEEAEMTLKLEPFPETAAVIGERLGIPADEMTETLDSMAHKGLIGSMTFRGKQRYIFSPFVIGIYEYQVYRLDKELVEMVEEYLPVLMGKLGGVKPGLLRTIPVNAQADPGKELHLYEDIKALLEKARSFKVQECICRQETAIAGHGCEHTLENCLSFSSEPNAFEYFSHGGRVITKNEALKILEEAAEEGLVHNAAYNVKRGSGGICNCCTCSCGVMRGKYEYGGEHTMARSNYVAVIDQDECSECGICAEERCPVEAIIEDDGYEVKPGVCIGCGVCTVTCPTEAIRLKLRPEEEQNDPPDNMGAWVKTRLENQLAEGK